MKLVGIIILVAWVISCFCKSRTPKLPAMNDDDFMEYMMKQASANGESERKAIDREYIKKYSQKEGK